MSSDVYTPAELKHQESVRKELLQQGIDISSTITNLYEEEKGVIPRYKSYSNTTLYSYNFLDRDDDRRMIIILNTPFDKKKKTKSELSNIGNINKSYSLSDRDETRWVGEYLNDRIKISTSGELLRIECLFFLCPKAENYHSYVGSNFQGNIKSYLDEYYRGIKILKALTGFSLEKDERPSVTELKVSFYYKRQKGFFSNRWTLHDSFVRVNCRSQAFDETMIKFTHKTRLSTRYKTISPYAELYSVPESLKTANIDIAPYTFPFLEELINTFNTKHLTDFKFQDKEKIQKLIDLLAIQSL